MKNQKKYLFISLTFIFILFLFQINVEASSTYQESQIISGIEEWHKKGYTGSELEIIVIDKGKLSTSYKNIKNIEDPFGNVLTSGDVSSHMSKIVESIHMNAPDAKIYVFQDISMIYVYEWMKENQKDINIINFSLSRNLTEREKSVMPLFAKENVLMFTAIGNNAKENINPVSENPYWYSIGAIQNTLDGLKREDYSGISSNLSFVTFAGFNILNDYQFLGTSASTAFMTGMMGVYIDGYEKTNKEKPTLNHLDGLMKKNIIKIDNNKKEEIGNGVVRLPSIRILSNEENLETIVFDYSDVYNNKDEKKELPETDVTERGVTKKIVLKTNMNLKNAVQLKKSYMKVNFFQLKDKNI